MGSSGLVYPLYSTATGPFHLMVQVLMHGSDPTSREAAKSAKSPSWGVHGLRVLRGFA